MAAKVQKPSRKMRADLPQSAVRSGRRDGHGLGPGTLPALGRTGPDASSATAVATPTIAAAWEAPHGLSSGAPVGRSDPRDEQAAAIGLPMSAGRQLLCSSAHGVSDTGRLHFRVPRPSREMRNTVRTGRNHFRGQHVIRDADGNLRVLRVDSLLESNVAAIFSMRPEVVDIEEQVRVDWVDEFGKRRKHFFDFRLTLRDGRRLAVAVKPQHRADSPRFRAMIEAIASQTPRNVADAVFVMTEADIDPVELHNARLLMGVRETDAEADAAAERVVAPMIGGRSLRALTVETGLGVRGRRALLRLIRSGRLTLLERCRINDESLLGLRGAATC